MEEYRSGHNEPHSKCGVPQGTVGSNPTSSAKAGNRNRLLDETSSRILENWMLENGHKQYNCVIYFIEKGKF